MYTIEDLKNGKCAVENNGSLKELQKVLKLAFPICSMEIKGTANYYLVSKYNSINWDCYDSPSSVKVPIQSVKDFLKPQFERGEKVMVRDDDHEQWMKRIYLTTVPELGYPHICVEGGGEVLYMKGECQSVTTWKHIRKIEEEKIVELTLKEVSEKLGIPAHLIRIKD